MIAENNKSKTVYVTGIDEKYFLMVLPLLHSFETFCSNEKLYVCDFDLNEKQRQFFKHKEMLLPRPSNLPEGLHPYRNKSAIKYYLEDVEYDNVVWIDSDCLVVGPLSQGVDNIVDGIDLDQPLIASSADGDRYEIAEFFKRFPAEPFEYLVKKFETPPDNLYLNCGVFILRSQETLKDWFTLSSDIPIHPMFEQNMFNILAYRNFPSIHELDLEVWNVHDLALNDLEVIRPKKHGPFSVKLGEKEVLVVHATSYESRAAGARTLTIPITENSAISGPFRFVHNEAINSLFIEMAAAFIIYNKELLINCEIGS
jgi:hypothetical protein